MLLLFGQCLHLINHMLAFFLVIILYSFNSPGFRVANLKGQCHWSVVLTSAVREAVTPETLLALCQGKFFFVRVYITHLKKKTSNNAQRVTGVPGSHT